MNAYLIAAFANELEKDAAVPKLLQSLWHSGAARGAAPRLLQGLWRSGAGRAVAGGAAGAGVGALADPENRLRGALLGGALGAGGGYVSPLVTAAGRKRALEGAKHLGRKAKHEVTGKGRVPIRPGAKPEEVKKLLEAERLGLTSIPGTVKGLVRRPGQTIKGAWQHAGKGGKLMAAGDVALGTPHILDPSTQQGTGQKVLGTLGSSGGYLLGSRMGLLGSMALGSGLGYLGGKAGKVFGGGRPVTQAPKGVLSEAAESVPSRPTTVFAKKQLAQAVPEVGRLVGPG